MRVRGIKDFTNGHRTFTLFDKVNKAMLHSNQPLEELNYCYSGPVHLMALVPTDIPVTIECDFFRCRHMTSGEIVKLHTGTYKSKGVSRKLKLMGVIREGELKLVVGNAKDHLADISPYMPVRVSGTRQLTRLFTWATGPEEQACA